MRGCGGVNHKPPKFPSFQLQSIEQHVQVNRFAVILEGVVPATFGRMADRIKQLAG